jgi:SNF2 family DNA or RNA helicase
MVRIADGQLLPLPGRRLRVMLGTLTDLFGSGPLAPGGRLRLPAASATRLVELEEADLRWSGGEELRELGRRLREFAGWTPVSLPSGFEGTLRPYQLDGLSWLQFLREHELGGILADDMGLGKTVQLLAHLHVEKSRGRMDRPSLVVAPTSVVTNWRREASRFAPALRVLALRGTGRKRRLDELAEHDVVLTTYPLLHRDEAHLRAQEFHLLVLDEAQLVKNAKSKSAGIVRELRARHRICLTGTPMENHLGELWSLFDFLMPGLLGDAKRFRKAFRNPIEKEGCAVSRARLAARVRPFLLRRTKAEVEAELPPKTETVQAVELQAGQRDLYESLRLAMHDRVRKAIERRGLARSTIVILDALLKLRQVCCDPRLLSLPQARRVAESAKLDALREMLAELVEDGRRILLFSQFTSMLALIEAELARAGTPFVRLTGDTRDRDTPVRRFQAGEVPLFLISLKAGGTGLNLTAADTVIHYDPWWNPAVEEQATDRAHRIGQDKPVFVYKLIVSGSVEEKIVALQARKRALAQGIYATGKGSTAPLTTEDLEELFRPLD